MKDSLSNSFFLVIMLILIFNLSSCQKTPAEKEPNWWEESQSTEETEPKPLQPKGPVITEEMYVEITARAALIFDKYRDDLDEAHRQMEQVYQKFKITFSDYDRYRRSLPPEKKRQLEKQVQEFIQKIYKEYFDF